MKRRLITFLICIGFSLVFVGPSLAHHDIIVLPMIAKILLIGVTVFYLNVYLFMPKSLFKGRYVTYVIFVLATIAVLMGVIVMLAPWHEILPKQPMQSQVGMPMQGWLLPILGMFFASTLYGYFMRDRKMHKREIDLTHQNIEFEMKFLKSQINPHFLFNALNNIYALSVIKSERTPDMILKLSDMLRFTLYGSESMKVKIGKEIDYINNFIEFQKLKMDSEPNIKIDTSNCNTELLIEPMLLIPFIENSFKHGNIDNVKRGWLQLEIKTLGPVLIFKVKNSLPSIAINKDEVGGIGVENVRKRLEILYPKRFTLDIQTTNSAYSVYLEIDTNSADS
ncbi:MAG: histidine kinase [Bacteroidales bacterium]|nr:histidine kinase [Bacteroidales bacterium]